MLASIGSFLAGLIIGVATGCISGAILYWYFVVHRKKLDISG